MNNKIETNGHLIQETPEPYENEYAENNPYFCERCNSRFCTDHPKSKCTKRHVGPNLAKSENEQ